MPNNISPNIRSAQTNAFAMQYGLGLGVYQIIIGAFFISGLNSPFSSLLVLALLLATPILAIRLMLRFRNSVCDGQMSFGRGLKFGLLMHIYAGFILALATYIYFAYLDHGTVANYYTAALTQPESAAMLTAVQPEMTADAFVKLIRELTPAAYASNMLINNTLLGGLVSAFTAAVIRK